MKTTADIVIVGTGVAGLYCALNLPDDKEILMICKTAVEESDSFLAQGGICMLRDDDDYATYFEDTMRAGHYENKKESVDIMLRDSQAVISDLIHIGVDFEKNPDGSLKFTREGAHTHPRICFHKDETGKEITSKLLKAVQRRKNIKIIEYCKMIDIIEENNRCVGIVAVQQDGTLAEIDAKFTVLATGGIGGLYSHSTNYPHLTADAIAISVKHNIELENLDYVQIHPTTLYSEKHGRRFLISESARGEGAVIYNSDMQRFVDELLPRDVVSAAIYREMEKDKKPYVWLSMQSIPKDIILSHFPNIYTRCLEEGYDITKECIPIVPSQHYFMGGIKVDKNSKTSMSNLYAAGETSCNGVHGRNRLASNSLLEALVFAKRAAKDIERTFDDCHTIIPEINLSDYTDCDKDYNNIVRNEIERMKKNHE